MRKTRVITASVAGLVALAALTACGSGTPDTGDLAGNGSAAASSGTSLGDDLAGCAAYDQWLAAGSPASQSLLNTARTDFNDGMAVAEKQASDTEMGYSSAGWATATYGGEAPDVLLLEAALNDHDPAAAAKFEGWINAICAYDRKQQA